MTTYPKYDRVYDFTGIENQDLWEDVCGVNGGSGMLIENIFPLKHQIITINDWLRKVSLWIDGDDSIICTEDGRLLVHPQDDKMSSGKTLSQSAFGTLMFFALITKKLRETRNNVKRRRLEELYAKRKPLSIFSAPQTNLVQDATRSIRSFLSEKTKRDLVHIFDVSEVGRLPTNQDLLDIPQPFVIVVVTVQAYLQNWTTTDEECNTDFENLILKNPNMSMSFIDEIQNGLDNTSDKKRLMSGKTVALNSNEYIRVRALSRCRHFYIMNSATPSAEITGVTKTLNGEKTFYNREQCNNLYDGSIEFDYAGSSKFDFSNFYLHYHADLKLEKRFSGKGYNGTNNRLNGLFKNLGLKISKDFSPNAYLFNEYTDVVRTEVEKFKSHNAMMTDKTSTGETVYDVYDGKAGKHKKLISKNYCGVVQCGSRGKAIDISTVFQTTVAAFKTIDPDNTVKKYIYTSTTSITDRTKRVVKKGQHRYSMTPTGLYKIDRSFDTDADMFYNMEKNADNSFNILLVIGKLSVGTDFSGFRFAASLRTGTKDQRILEQVHKLHDIGATVNSPHIQTVGRLLRPNSGSSYYKITFESFCKELQKDPMLSYEDKVKLVSVFRSFNSSTMYCPDNETWDIVNDIMFNSQTTDSETKNKFYDLMVSELIIDSDRLVVVNQSLVTFVKDNYVSGVDYFNYDK